MWFPWVHPRSYHKGDALDILVGQLVSHEAAVPYDFYMLNWCDSVAGHQYNPEMGISANEVKILESPYDVSIPPHCSPESSTNSRFPKTTRQPANGP